MMRIAFVRSVKQTSKSRSFAEWPMMIYLSLLLLRMPLIVKDTGEWIGKDCRGLFETDTMFLRIGSCLRTVPFKSQTHGIRSIDTIQLRTQTVILNVRT
jgi:hypothetical protein